MSKRSKVTDQSNSYEVWYLNPSKWIVANISYFWILVSYFSPYKTEFKPTWFLRHEILG